MKESVCLCMWEWMCGFKCATALCDAVAQAELPGRLNLRLWSSMKWEMMLSFPEGDKLKDP